VIWGLSLEILPVQEAEKKAAEPRAKAETKKGKEVAPKAASREAQEALGKVSLAHIGVLGQAF